MCVALMLSVFAFASVKEGNVIKVRGRHKCPCGCFSSRPCPFILFEGNKLLTVKRNKTNLTSRERERKTPGITSARSCQTLLPVWLTGAEQPLLEESRCRRSLCLKPEGCHLPLMKTAAGGEGGSAALHYFG